MIKATKEELLFDCTSGFDAWLRFKTRGDKDTIVTSNGKSVVVSKSYGCKKVREAASM